MTVIAWDGKTLAVDRMIGHGDRYAPGTKLHVLDSGAAIAWCGNWDQALELIDWYESGEVRDKWPDFQSSDGWTELVKVDKTGKCEILCQRPYWIPVESPPFAWGSGCEVAMGAMKAGKNAIEAVEIANGCIITCGCGVDSYTVEATVVESIPE